MRRHFQFPCSGEQLSGTVDEAISPVGLLIVSGGNEVRAGAFGGQAQLAAKIAASGFPVMRFDRRGVGDSTGENGGYRTSGPDIAAALEAFRAEASGLSRVVAFGNCDAATALALRSGAGCAGLIMANPWTFSDNEVSDALPPPAAIRSRYVSKLCDPKEWGRLLRGNVDLGKLTRGLKGAVASESAPSSLAEEIAQSLSKFDGEVQILLAARDRTAQAFSAAWPKDDPRISALADADHAFSSDAARAWLFDAILGALHEQARQLDMR